jgi:hypothetical protein
MKSRGSAVDIATGWTVEGSDFRVGSRILTSRYRLDRLWGPPNFLYELKKLHGLSTRVNYTDRVTAACRRSDCRLLWIEGDTWSA